MNMIQLSDAELQADHASIAGIDDFLRDIVDQRAPDAVESAPEPEREYSFSEIMAAVAQIERVPGAKLVALFGRAKNLIRVGLFPDKGRGGRGHTAWYSRREAFTLYLATSLNLDGLTPEHITTLIHRRGETLHVTAAAGRVLAFHPESALAGLCDRPNARANGWFVWPVGSMRKALFDALDH